MSKRRIGPRTYRANIQIHNGSLDDAHGNPTYDEVGDWETIIENWPCEIVTTGGEEVIGSRQVSGTTTHMIYGAFAGGNQIRPQMRLEVEGVYYSVTAAYDALGDRQEMKVEAKREIE